MKPVRFRCEVVASIPETLDPNVLYVTSDRDVAGHLCACGCGREVITPISPTDWSIRLDGRGASLSPSIGNWSFPCRSHYYIRGGAVAWAGDMSDTAVARGRRWDKASKARYYEGLGEPASVPSVPTQEMPPQHMSPARRSRARAILSWLRRWIGW